MRETESENGSETWKKFLRKHWIMAVSFVVGAVLAALGAVLVYLWFVGDAQATRLVPATLDRWSIGHVVSFLLHLALWEVLIIGIPVALAAAAVYLLWWRTLPEEERKVFRTSSRTTSGGGGMSLFFFIVFCIKIYVDGNWDSAIASWTFDYLVYSCLTALIWILIIIGIPVALGLVWWIHHETKKKT